MEAYEREYRQLGAAQLEARKAAVNAQPTIKPGCAEPNSMQQAFLARLKALRSNGAERALLISATGTGKTFAAAFAVRDAIAQFQRTPSAHAPRDRESRHSQRFRMLFIVHREQIARQALKSFRIVLGGILIGLPLISGPISVFLAIENGAGFAVETARGALAGTVALAVFTCVYAAVCPKGWLKASFLSVALYVLASWIAAELPISAVTLAVAAAAAIILSLWIMPVPHGAAVKHRPPKHDLLMRMGMMMVLMIAITFLAPYIGPTASGIASTFPYMALTMAVFSQIQGGPDDARRAMHGLMLGMYSGLAFNAVVWTLAAEDRLLIAYAAATAAALAAQGVVLALTLKKTP